MKRAWIGVAAGVAIAAGLWWSPAMAPTRTVAYRELAQTFTALQTFSASFGAEADLTITAPASGPSASSGSVFGSCGTANDPYRIYIAWANRSGISALGPASSDVTMAGSGRYIAVTRSESLPATATHWLVYWSHAADSHATKKLCVATGAEFASLDTGTTTYNCACSSTGASHSGTNGTGVYDTATINASGLISLNNQVSFATLPVQGENVIYVCKQGCVNSTVQQGLNAVIGATSTNRFVVLIGPGDYDENPFPKSWVTLRGISREGTRIRGTATVQTMTVAANVTWFGIENMTVGGRIPIQCSGTNSPRAFTFIHNAIIGIADGTENSASGKSIDGVFDSSLSRDWVVTNTVFRNTFDSVRVGVNGRWWGLGNSYFITDDDTPNVIRVFYPGGNASQVTEIGPSVTIESAGDTAIAAFQTNVVTGTPAQAEKWTIVAPVVRVKTTNASRTAASHCVWLEAAAVNTNANTFTIAGMDCEIEAASSDTTSALYGIRVSLDTDHATWTALLNGGVIRLVNGATRTDVQQDETTAGFSIKMDNIRHAGVYAGAGTVDVDAPLTDVRHRLSPLVNAPAACSIGDRYSDTSGADCYCSAANTWTNTIAVGACV